MVKAESLRVLRFLLPLVALGALFSFGCSDAEDQGGKKAQGAHQAQGFSGRNVQEFIAYYNGVVNLLNGDASPARMQRHLQTMKAHGPIAGARYFEERFNVLEPVDLSSALGAETWDKLKMEMKNFQTLVARFYAKVDEYGAYQRTKAYESDNWAKGDSLIAGCEPLIKQTEAVADSIMSSLGPWAEKADALALEGSPFKEQVLAGRELVSRMEEILQSVAGGHEEAAKNSIPSLDSALGKVRAALEAGKKLGAGPRFNASLYQGLIISGESFLGNLRTLLKENKSAAEQRTLNITFDMLQRNYKAAVDALNRSMP